MADGKNIRNFVIIAHIDHGKSTLADRFLELTGAVEKRKMRTQFLDMNPLEREKGITIKMQPVRMLWRMPQYRNLELVPDLIGDWNLERIPISNDQTPSSSDSKHEYVLNLIDTPGHADFSYEVSRALAAVEGAILLVDATQGVQAQTLANLDAARREGLVIIPAANKIDLPSADIQKTAAEICTALGVAQEEIFRVSAKTGEGVDKLLAAVVRRVPPPAAKIWKHPNTNSGMSVGAQSGAALRALVFDSKYDSYLGVVAHIRITDGALKKGERIYCMATDTGAEALEVGVFAPERVSVEALAAGEIGYVATGIKETARVRVGDTITHADAFKYLNIEILKQFALPGYHEPAPVVFATLFPEDQDDFERLRDALGKLQLEDAALLFTPEDAGALGRGFRAGFLGLLHIEIVVERLRREYGLALALSRPSVAFRVAPAAGGAPLTVYTASRMPPPQEIARIEEPWARMEIVAPARYLGALISLITAAEGIIIRTEMVAGDRLRIEGEAPLREVIVDFYDRLKSVSQGFASFSYSFIGYRPADLVRLDIVVAGEVQHTLAEMAPASRAYDIGRSRVASLKELLPRELFAVALQAAVGGRIIARETLPALKKDVTGYMYGGDRTRKMKLWKKQQRGKKRLKEAGRVVIPPDVFFKLQKGGAGKG